MAFVFEDRSELVERGRLVTFEIPMDPIPDRRMRTIRIWTPELYDGVRRFPVLYLHDGEHVFAEKDLPAGMGRWDIDKRICELEPEAQCMVVAIDSSVDRGSELLPPYRRNPKFRIPRSPGAPEIVALGGYYADFVRDALRFLFKEDNSVETPVFAPPPAPKD